VVSDETRPDQERVFAVSDTNTVGPGLDELKEGDKVSIFYADSESDSGQPINATTIEKVADTGDAAMTGETAEVEGAVDEVDEGVGTVTVEGQEFAVEGPEAVGVDPGTGTMEVVEIMTVE
jgi:hypothetical protein